MDAEMLVGNVASLIGTLVRLKPSSAKGTYIKSIAISSTMGPGVRVDPLDAQRSSESA
jgi:large subunit ribosomal protein L1